MFELPPSQPLYPEPSTVIIAHGGVGIDAGVDYLYLTPREDSLTYVRQDKGKGVDPNFHSAFRVHMRIDARYEGWDVTLAYARFATDEKRNSKGDNLLATLTHPRYSQSSSNISSVATARTDWSIQFNDTHVHLGKSFEPEGSPHFHFHPYVGVRYVNIIQNWKTHYTRSIGEDTIDLHHDYHGHGVQGGFLAQWGLPCGLAFYGDISSSILHSEYRTHFHEEFLTDPTTFYDHIDTGKGTLDLDFGLILKTFARKNRYAFAFKVGFEHHIFFNHTLWPDFPTASLIGKSTTRGEDLSLQGYKASLIFSF